MRAEYHGLGSGAVGRDVVTTSVLLMVTSFPPARGPSNGRHRDAGGIDDGDVIASLTHPPCQARLEIRVVGAQMSFEVGSRVSRHAHERWRAEIRAWNAGIDLIAIVSVDAFLFTFFCQVPPNY